MRFTGHLDLQHTWMRVFQRAGIDLEFSQGFHPLPKVQLASALPLGYIGENEIMDIWTQDHWDLAELAMRISGVLPPGLVLNHMEEVPLNDPKIQVALKLADYKIILPSGSLTKELPERIQALLALTDIPVVRRTKQRNMREWIISIELHSG